MASNENIDLKDAGNASCCETTVEYSKFYIVWYVKNFSYCRQSTGEALSSCIFSAEESGSLKFRVDLYPTGTADSPDDVVIGIRLVTDKDDLKVFVKYDCFLANKEQKMALHRKQGECFLIPGRYCHPVKLLTRKQLMEEKNKLFPEDVLMLACALQTSHKETAKVPKFEWKSHL